MTNFEDRLLNTETYFSAICNECVNKYLGDTCTAYPNGIPSEILIGNHIHTTPFEGDSGILFSPISGVAKELRNAK